LFLNPKTEKLKRQGTIDTNINIHKNRKTRMQALQELQRHKTNYKKRKR